MTGTTLEQLLQHYAQQLADAFQRASKTGKGSPSEIAERRENALRSLLQRLFPPPYHIVKGQISDVQGATSQSIDAIVVNPVHPHTIDSEGKFELIFADGVDCAIEVKPDLTTNELHRGLAQLRSVKQRLRTRSPLVTPSQRSQEERSHSLRIPTWLFTTHAPSNLHEFIRTLRATYATSQVPPEEQIDFIAINERGIICNYKLPSHNPWPHGSPPRTGHFFEEWGSSTLAGMILHMNFTTPAVARFTEPILSRYLKDLSPSQITRFPDPALERP